MESASSKEALAVDQRENNAIETAKLLTTDIEQYRKRMNSSTISYVTLSLVTLGAALKYRQDLDWLAASAICAFLLCVSALTVSVVWISRARASYSKCVRHDLIASLRFPEGLRCLDEVGRVGLTQDVRLEKLGAYRGSRPGLTKCYTVAIIAVTILTVTAVISISSYRTPESPESQPAASQGSGMAGTTPRQ